MNRKNIIQLIVTGLFLLFVGVSFPASLQMGKQMARTFLTFIIFVIRILPSVFILIGLFEVWVKRETIEHHFGSSSGIRGIVWPILLGATTIGGLFVAFPIAFALQNKGARKSAIYTYLGAATVFRIPMTLFEASFMGMKFTLIRMLTALPLIILSSMLLERMTTEKAVTPESQM
jgi:uncharacterized membrane protein YraQ (UPF0718 family)